MPKETQLKVEKSVPTTNYSPSSPALHTAEVLFRNYQLSERGRVEATKHNVAVVVDACTQVFRFELHLTALVKAAPWNQPTTLKDRLDLVRDAVTALQAIQRKLPRYENAPPSDGKAVSQEGYHASAPAVYAARGLVQNFLFTQRANLAPTERNIAIIVDVCTEIFRIEQEVYRVAKVVLGQHPEQLVRNLEQLQQALRAVELVRNRMPRQAPQMRVTIREGGSQELRLTREQQAEAQRLSTLVAGARTIKEQQGLLVKAGIVRYQ